MAWDTGFLFDLLRPVKQVRMLIDDVDEVEFAPGGATIRLSSHRMPGYNEVISTTGARVSPGIVSIGDWRTTVGEMVIGIRPVIDLRTILARGRLVSVRVGFEGYAEADYQPVFLGHVQAFERSGDEWTLTLRSVVASLISRFDETGGATQLFGDSAETTMAVNYVAAGGIGPVSFTVTDDSAVIADENGDFLFQIFPDDGDPFFIRATTQSGGGLFTGASTTPLFGQDALTATAGARVVFCASIPDNPISALRKILTSTDAGTNGSDDVLDGSWGIGFPVAFLDLDDLDTTEGLIGSPGDWEIYATEPADDALGWLQETFNPAGIILCERQGLLTARQIFPSYIESYAVETITNRDIIVFESQETWDSTQPLEFAAFAVTDPSGAILADGSREITSFVLEDLDSRPASGERVAHLAYVDVSTATAWADLVVDRLGPWSTRVPERVTVLCRGLRLAALTAGDHVIIDSRFFSTRDRVELPQMTVLGVETAWFAGTVRLFLGYSPEDADEF